jgi:hypothetical protein
MGESVFSETGCMGLSLIGPSQRKRRRRKRGSTILYFADGVEAKYVLVPWELEVGYFCGHMVDYEEVCNCIL